MRVALAPIVPRSLRSVAGAPDCGAEKKAGHSGRDDKLTQDLEIEKDSDQRASVGVSRLRQAKSRTAWTFSRVRPSYRATISEMVKPSSIFSKTTETGM